MSYLVFDIETVGQKFDAFDEKTQDILRGWAVPRAGEDSGERFEAELEKIKQGLPLSPFLGEIVAVSVLDHEGKGGSYFQAPGGEVASFEEGDLQYRVLSEKGILEKFWDVARHYSAFVTFNGRGFDVPYLMIRAAVHNVYPTRDLMTNRYLGLQRGSSVHIDLQDQLTFYGAMYPRPNLHFVTKAFGIESPKTGDIAGKDVPKAFDDKKYEEIARYCMRDVFATRELYKKWKEYFSNID